MEIEDSNTGIIQSGTIVSHQNFVSYSVIIVNLEKRKALVCNAWKDGNRGLRSAQQEDLRRFSAEWGDKVAFIIEGTRSTSSILVERELAARGIEVLPLKRVTTEGEAPWNVQFDLETRLVTVTDQKGKLLYRDTPFPPFIEVPENERDLNDKDRIIGKLSRHVDADTSELNANAQTELKQILELKNPDDLSMSIGNTILNNLMTQRARAAGFSGSDSYFDANPANFTDVPKGGLELVLRKIRGYTETFEKSGVDFSQIKVTPDAVSGLLKDYPELLLRFTKSLGSSTEKAK